jgi:hypothetical protein
MRLLVCVLLAGCSGDAPKTPDGGFKCSGAAYDPCNTEHDCMSAVCHNFGTIQVCTQACTAGDSSTCPKQNGAAQTCTAAGVCQPAAANTCHL